jgi:lysophospholipase L1-like esterase
MPPLLIISLSLNLLSIIAGLLLIIFYPRLIEWFFIPPSYERRFSIFANSPIQSTDIVFLGDSITEWFPLDEMFPGLPIKNRGISGDTTDGVLRRLHQVTDGQPRQIFLKIGTNDIGFGHSQSRIIANYEMILARIKAESPQTEVFVQSILPRHRRFAGRIQRINQEIAQLAQKYGYRYLDFFPAFADERGGIRPEFSNDDLHLLYAGYAQWQSLLKPYIYGGGGN